MIIYNPIYNSQLGQIVKTATEITVAFKSSVDSASDLPETDTNENDVRLAMDTKHLYCRLDGKWIDQGVFDMSDIKAEFSIQGLS